MPNYSANYDSPDEIKAMAAHWSQTRSKPQPDPQPASEQAPVQSPKTDALDRMRSEWNSPRTSTLAPKTQPSTDPIAGALKVPARF